jgi:hypothetical protein
MSDEMRPEINKAGSRTRYNSLAWTAISGQTDRGDVASEFARFFIPERGVGSNSDRIKKGSSPLNNRYR